MKKNFTLFKTLLVAVGLLGGSSAWADDITAIPVTYNFSATDATVGPFSNSAIVSGTNIGNVLLVNSKSTATAWVDVDAVTEGRQAYSIAANEKVTVGLSVYHGWESNNRSATVSIYNSAGVSLASYVYNINSTQITAVSFGGTAVSPFTAFGYKNSGNGTNGFVANQQLDISVNISGSGYVDMTFMNGNTNAGSFSATLATNVALDIARIEVNSGCDVADRGYHVKSLALSSETVSEAMVTYQFQDMDGNSLASLKADQTAPGTIGDAIADVIPDSYKNPFYNGDESVKYVYNSYACADASVPAAGTTVTLKFTALNKFTYNVKAVDADDNELATMATVSGFAGDTKDVFWSKYIKVDNQWYVSSENTFYQNGITAAGTKNIKYNVSDIAYFIECENMNGVRQDRWTLEQNSANSGYRKIRINQYYSTIYTDALAEGGVFDLLLPYNNSNSSNHTYQIRTRDASGNLTNVAEWTCENGAKTYTLKNIVIPAGHSLAISCDGISGNSNARMDYLTLTPSKATKSISAAGWATYCFPYALDLANATGLTDAYIVTGGANGILTKTAVTGTVPANTGLLLKGSEGTVTIPVVANGTTDVTGNKLVGVTAETQIAANTGYVLMNDATNGLGFYKNANAFTVGANTAYLPANFDSNEAKARFFSLVDENATAINGVESKKAENGVMYNLAGQRVGKDYKGIVIVNGKKVMNK